MKDFKYQFLLFFGVLFLAQVAYANAAIFTSQPLLQNSDTTTDPHQYNLLGSGWSGTLTSVSYNASSAATSSVGFQLNAVFILCHSGSTATTTADYCQSSTIVATGTSPITQLGQLEHFFTVNNVVIESNKYYQIAFCTTTSTVIVASTCNTGFRSGITTGYWFSSASPSGWPSGPTWNVVFNSGVTNTSINLDFPPATTTPDFSNWVLTITGGSSSTARAGVMYGASTSSLNFSDEISYSPFVFTNPVRIGKSQKLWWPPLNPNTGVVWYAQPYLKNGSGTIVVAGSVTQFTVAPVADIPNPLSTSTLYAGPFGQTSSSFISSATENCQRPSSSFFSAPGDNIAYGICAAGQFLFVPSQNSQQVIDNSIGNFQGLFPFSVYFSIKSAVDTSVSSTLASSTSDLVIPFDFGSSTINVPLFTSTTVSSTLGATVASYYFQTMTFIIYAGLGFLIYTTVI